MGNEPVPTKKEIPYIEYHVFTDLGGFFIVYAIDYQTAINVARVMCNEMGFAGFTVKQ